MTLQRIQALQDLDHGQLVNLARQRSIFSPAYDPSEWSSDRLRLKLIDNIVEEELREQRIDGAEGQGRR